MEEWSDHVELICIGHGKSLVMLLVLLQCWELSQFVPFNLADFLAGSRLKVSVPRDTREDIKSHVLFTHGDLNVLH